MDINVCVEEVILDDSPVYVVYPEDDIYAEVVGVTESKEEAWSDFADSFNQMMYSDNGIPILIEAFLYALIPTFSNTSPSCNMKRKQLDSRCCILAKFRKFALYGKEFTNKE